MQLWKNTNNLKALKKWVKTTFVISLEVPNQANLPMHPQTIVMTPQTNTEAVVLE